MYFFMKEKKFGIKFPQHSALEKNCNFEFNKCFGSISGGGVGYFSKGIIEIFM